ncbi:MAG: glycolate oxidase subunit GlcF [Rhizobiales bacterium]|nr:glycolate oxidase subunit GlcF [Hyphomicrobiales bacterium]
MQTAFTPEQLKDPNIAEANTVLRTCVRCGFCTATCPTYVLLGDERDSPRGRIYLIKNMLESGAPATEETARHVDRCLSCLACMTTCPSGVNYMRLIDQARIHVENTYARALPERFMREVLAFVMPRPGIFRLAIIAAALGRPFRSVFAALGLKRVDALFDLVPSLPKPPDRFGSPGTYPAQAARKGRVALLRGCVQSVLDPGINAATIRLLTRLGYDVVVTSGESCCGSLTHHMGKEDDALARARRTIDQWDAANVEAVIITSSGCGVTIKDYGHMFRLESEYAGKAARIAAKARDITEFLGSIELPAPSAPKLRIAYHSACSMQHGQKIRTLPQALLCGAGFEVVEAPESHLCCGSAGTYNILQPDIAKKLRVRKVSNIESTKPDVIAAGNLGCLTQIGAGTSIPLVHTVELLDWAYGGPKPDALG